MELFPAAKALVTGLACAKLGCHGSGTHNVGSALMQFVPPNAVESSLDPAIKAAVVNVGA